MDKKDNQNLNEIEEKQRLEEFRGIQETLGNLDFNPVGEHLVRTMSGEIGYESDLNEATGSLYRTSNEQLDDMFAKLDFDKKSVFTVGSSGDQLLYSLLYGAKKVTLADANPMARMFAEYKYALIKNLSFEEMQEVFTVKNFRTEFDHSFKEENKADLYNWKVYSKISHDLSEEAKMFWDSIMMEITSDPDMLELMREISFNRDYQDYFYQNARLVPQKDQMDYIEFLDSLNLGTNALKILNLCSPKMEIMASVRLLNRYKEDPELFEEQFKSMLSLNAYDLVFDLEGSEHTADLMLYSDKETYQKMQQILQEGDFDIDFRFGDIFDKSIFRDDVYDIVLLSNVNDYVDKEVFIEGVNNIYKNHLAPRGVIQVSYDWGPKSNVPGEVVDRVYGDWFFIKARDKAVRRDNIATFIRKLEQPTEEKDK